MGLVDEDECIVPTRDDRRDVVAPALVSRIVYDTDRAMRDRLVELTNAAVGGVVEDHKSRVAAGTPFSFDRIMHDRFPALGACFRDGHPLHRRAPFFTG